MGVFSRDVAGIYDWFMVVQAASANPTWPTGNGGSVTAASLPASAITGPGVRVVLHSITSVASSTGAQRAVGGIISLFKGDGTTQYISTAAVQGYMFTTNFNTPGHNEDILFSDGLAVNDVLAVSPTAGIRVAFSLV